MVNKKMHIYPRKSGNFPRDSLITYANYGSCSTQRSTSVSISQVLRSKCAAIHNSRSVSRVCQLVPFFCFVLGFLFINLSIFQHNMQQLKCNSLRAKERRFAVCTKIKFIKIYLNEDHHGYAFN